MEIKQNEVCRKISQQAYAKTDLKRFGFENFKPVSTPMLNSRKVPKPEKALEKPFAYRSTVVALMYLMLGTRLHQVYNISFLSSSLKNPSDENFVQVKSFLLRSPEALARDLQYTCTT